MVMFLIGHLILAIVVSTAVYFVPMGAGLFFLLGMELGQAKSKVPGSVKNPSKWIAMLRYCFTPFVLKQWLPQGIIAGLLVWWSNMV